MASSGNVTFLFTDIEGSTKLAQKYPEQYPFILEKHDSILTKVIEVNNGFIFKKVGDAFCASFAKDEDAVNASVEIQKKLMSEFKVEPIVKIRIGVHKGDAEFLNGDYIGYVTLSRVQRLMSVAHGGQILVTKEIFDSIQKKESKFIFRDFGLRKMKDIIVPEHVYQLSAEGLPSEFPPLITVDVRQTNIPSQVTNFIGRKKEIPEIKKHFKNTRLLSLIGPGGTGKTRLALQSISELIDEFEHGVWVIELAPITDAEIIIKSLIDIFKLKEDPNTDSFVSLKNFLKDKNILLLFDNSEHLLQKCSTVVEGILSFCPRVKIITTSREPFNIHGEFIYRVPPLSLPSDIKNETFESLSEFESIRLFNDRAVSVNPNFTLTEHNIKTVAELCKHLDGIPLAIELAARRINVLSVEKILERLSDRFKLLTSGSSTALPRQKTLRALIDWSYDMLGFKEQLLFQRLSVFQGGWTLEAAEIICGDETLDELEILDLMNELLDKSLINYNEENGNARFGMLETIKEYAFEKLNDKATVLQKKIAYYIKLTDQDFESKTGTDHSEWLRVLKPEIDNIRTCIQQASELSLPEVADLVLNAFDYWHDRGNFSEAEDALEKILAADFIKDDLVKGKVIEKIAQLCYYSGELEKLKKLAEESMEIYKNYNYTRGIIQNLNTLSLKSYIESDEETALKLTGEALELCGNTFNDLKASTMLNRSAIFGYSDDKTKCIEMKEEALRIFREEKNTNKEALTLCGISVVISRSSKMDLKKSIQYAEESLAISKRLEDHYLISVNLIQLGSVNLLYLKDMKNAEYLLLEGYKIIKDYGYILNLYPVNIYIGILYIECNKYDEAEKYYLEYFEKKDHKESEYFIKDAFHGLAKVFFEQKKFKESAMLFGMYDKLSLDARYKALVSRIYTFKKERAELKSKLGDEDYLKFTEEGKEMTIDEMSNKIIY